MKKFICLTIVALLIVLCLTGCDETTGGSEADTAATLDVGDKLANNQPTPTDIDYSLERYNLIKRAYWVNGQREKANAYLDNILKEIYK